MDFDENTSFLHSIQASNFAQQAVADVAEEIADVFRDIAPRDTGNMVKSTHVTTELVDGKWEANVNVPVENERGTKYAKFVEFGTRYMHAQHNLRNAIEIVEGLNK